MNIETRFNEGDKLFFIGDVSRKIIETVVRGFKIELLNGEMETTWLCNKEPGQKINVKVEDKFAFPTKDALLKSL